MRKLLMQMQWKSAVVALMAGAVLLLTQMPIAAQEAHPIDGHIVLAQAMPNDHQGLGRAERILPFLLFGGSYQIMDATGEPCVGQCAFPNAITNSCACPEGFSGVDSARILVDIGVNQEGSLLTCGSTLVMCLK
jgi:hypothetical protein